MVNILDSGNVVKDFFFCFLGEKINIKVVVLKFRKIIVGNSEINYF